MTVDWKELPTRSHWERIGKGAHHGIAIPLFSLHSQSSCGVGEYLDLIPLIGWCQEVGMDLIQLLPLNDSGDDPSPYSGLSAFALNPIHLTLTALPQIETVASSEIAELQQRCRSQRLSYGKVREEKLAILYRYFERFGAEQLEQEGYQAFVLENRWLEGYARYLEPGARRIPFHSWVQYLCHEQLIQAADEAAAHGVLLMGDLPILISRASAEVWQHPELFDIRFSAGAPPDQYAAAGQNWGFPVYRWESHFETDFAWWQERLRVASRYYQIFRLDHVVGFFRLWSIPSGKKGTAGLFRPPDFEKQMEQGELILRRLIAATSMLPLGEDLGVIPDQVRHLMAQLGICGTKVVRWERDWQLAGQPYIAPERYPEMSLTTVSTHDSEPLQLWWQNSPEEGRAYAAAHGWSYTAPLARDQLYQMLQESHRTPSHFHVNPLQEYLALFPELVWGAPEEERINVPGTLSPTNWSYRLHPSLEELSAHEELKRAVRDLIR